MIPILFDKNETAFTSNGLGRLTDCTRCEVTEERNGVYECEFDYPVTGAMFAQITEGRYIFTTHDESREPQPFEIYFRSAPLEGVVTFRAWHISYMLNNVIVGSFTASSVSAAMAAIPTHSLTANPFTFWTDKEVTSDYTLSTPRAVRAVLGGAEGSLLDIYGKGDYEFDLWTVKLHQNRGTNRGVSIRYGKNLVSLNQERDASNMYSGIIPYWQDSGGENVVYLSSPVYRTGESAGRVVTMDLSDDFEEQPTTAQLQARAQAIIDGSDAYELKENLTIDFVALWQTEEYKDVANLQRIYLCDTVNIYYEKLGINATAKCIKVVYDSLRERYTSMELGTPKTTLARQILETTSDTLLKNVPSKSAMQSAIDKATEMIAGGFGGYIKFKYLSDGTPSEMLIMNTADEATATNIIRLNQNGIGFSTDGGTTYRNAWTIDGQLNADFINGGTITGVAINNGNGSFSVDSSGNLTASKATITGGTINLTGATRDTTLFTVQHGDYTVRLTPYELALADAIYGKTLRFGTYGIQGGLESDPQRFIYLGNDSALGGFMFLSGANYRVRFNTNLEEAIALMDANSARTIASIGRASNGNGRLILSDGNGVSRVTLNTSDLLFRDASANIIGRATVERSASVSGDRGYLVLENGLAMCWERKNVTVSIDTAWGSLYESAYTSLGSMPYTFGATPTVSVTVEANGSFAFMESVSDTSESSWGSTYFCRATPASAVTLTLNLFAIGIAAT